MRRRRQGHHGNGHPDGCRTASGGAEVGRSEAHALTRSPGEGGGPGNGQHGAQVLRALPFRARPVPLPIQAVRFPSFPGLDFAVEASNITVTLNRQPQKNAPDSAVLVNSPQRTGDNIANLSGRYFIDVGTADHSYVVRLTPHSGAAPPG